MSDPWHTTVSGSKEIKEGKGMNYLRPGTHSHILFLFLESAIQMDRQVRKNKTSSYLTMHPIALI